MFKAPCKAVAREVDYRIDSLYPMAPPPCPRLYRVFEDGFVAIKYTINDFIAKGEVRTTSSPYGAPVIAVLKKTRELHIITDYSLLD